MSAYTAYQVMAWYTAGEIIINGGVPPVGGTIRVGPNNPGANAGKGPASGKWNRPNCKDVVLKDAMENLWRDEDVRAGGTIGELQREIATGGNLTHFTKAVGRYNQIYGRLTNRILPQVSRADRIAAERVLADLKDVIQHAIDSGRVPPGAPTIR